MKFDKAKFTLFFDMSLVENTEKDFSIEIGLKDGKGDYTVYEITVPVKIKDA
jgi:hypothetical protein